MVHRSQDPLLFGKFSAGIEIMVGFQLSQYEGLTMNFRPLLLSALMLIAPAAFADKYDEPRYSYLDIVLGAGEIDSDFESDLDYGAAALVGSVALGDYFAMFGSIGATVVDAYDSDGFLDDDELEIVEYQIGINPHIPLSKTVHIVIPVALIYADAEIDDFSDDDTGWTAGIGLRALVNPSLEMGLGVQHVDIFDGDEQSLAGSIRWHITGLFSLAGGVNVSDDSTGGSLSFRFTF